MAAPRFKVTYQDGTEREVRVMPRAQVMFERHFTTSMSSLADQPSAERGYYLAWAALHCASMESRDFEAFLDALEDIENVGGDDEADPTKTGPGPEPSSS